VAALVVELSAVTQNQPLKVEIKGFKTGHFSEVKTALVGLVNSEPSYPISLLVCYSSSRLPVLG
jgi:hypothetical protein